MSPKWRSRLPSNLLIAILAGGRSSRMGRDKARLVVNSVPMLEHVVTAANATGYEVAVIGRENSDHTANVRFLPDIMPGLGPLGGLYTALISRTPTPDILLCPCDTPGLRTHHLQWLIRQWKQVKGRESATIPPLALVPTWDGRDQPLFAIYAGEILPIVSDQLFRKKYGMYHLLDAVKTTRIALPDEHKAAVADIDTPADLDAYGDPADL